MKPLTDEQFVEELSTTTKVPEDAGVVSLRSALNRYRTETLHWAERRSAVQPSLAAAARRSERWAALPRWSLATIAIVTIAAGVAHVSEQRGTMADAAANAPSSMQRDVRSSAEEIAADNKLLDSIDAELSYHALSPVDAFDAKQQQMRLSRENRAGIDAEE